MNDSRLERREPFSVYLHFPYLARLYGTQFKLEDAATLLGSKATIDRIRSGDDPSAIALSWAADEAKWRLTRAKYLLY